MRIFFVVPGGKKDYPRIEEGFPMTAVTVMQPTFRGRGSTGWSVNHHAKNKERRGNWRKKNNNYLP